MDNQQLIRSWRIELGILVILMVTTLVIFWNTSLDVMTSKQFYHPELADPWPVGHYLVWDFLHKWASAFIAALFIGSLFILIFVRKPTVTNRKLRLYAIYIMLVIALGPGLLINGVLKGHWGRPRPSQTISLGGDQAYVPPLKMGTSSEYKSFPAGHSSVGFVFVVFWFILRRRHQRLALVALGGSILFGLLFGMGRIVAGAHYLSDVLWAGMLTFLTASVVYHFVMQMPRRELQIESGDVSQIPALTPLKITGYSLLAVAMIVASLLAYRLEIPVDRVSEPVVKDQNYIVELWVDKGRVSINYDPNATSLVSVKGMAKGYGLPTNTVDVSFTQENDHLTTRLEHKGVYSELFSDYTFTINPDELKQLKVHINPEVQIVTMPEDSPQKILVE